MRNFKGLIERELCKTNNMLSELDFEELKLQKGTLIQKRKKDGMHYFLQIMEGSGGGKRRKTIYLGKEDDVEVRRFQKMRVQSELKKTLAANKRVLQEIGGKFQPYAISDIMNKLPPAYRGKGSLEAFDMTGPDRFCREVPSYARDWMAEEYRKNPTVLNEKTNIACTGERVRSKSEVIIYNALCAYGIPFRYECEIKIKDADGNIVARYPDFVILTMDGSLLYWEHAGKFFDDDYFGTFFDRLCILKRNGIYPGKNLIITCDSDRFTIDSKAVNDIIQNSVLPYVW